MKTKILIVVIFSFCLFLLCNNALSVNINLYYQAKELLDNQSPVDSIKLAVLLGEQSN